MHFARSTVWGLDLPFQATWAQLDSRASPLMTFLNRPKASVAPQAKFCWSKHLQARKMIHLWRLSIARAYLFSRLLVCVSPSYGRFPLWCLLAWWPSLREGHRAAHIVVIKCPRDHLWQLFYPGWLLHMKTVQESHLRLAAILLSTFTNTILKTKIL